MGRLTTFALFALVGGLLLGNAVAAGPEPTLVSAAPRSDHVAVTFSLAGLAPGELVAATSPRVSTVGALTRGIKLREKLRLRTTTGMIRARSRGALPDGRYYVQVSGIDLGGATDCVRSQPGCGQEWSNVRKVVVGRT
jgi:hypothetical protein